MNASAVHCVNGVVLIGAALDGFEDAHLNVYLEDVTLQDTSAIMIDQQEFTRISHRGGTQDRISFRLCVPHFDARASYGLRAHLSVHHDGAIHSGDCITTQSYPVLTFGAPDQVTLSLQQIS